MASPTVWRHVTQGLCEPDVAKRLVRPTPVVGRIALRSKKILSDSEEFVDLVADLLIESEDYPWKTARYLSNWLSSKGYEITPKTLEEVLFEHAGR